MAMPIPRLDRTPSAHRGAIAGVWCLEREFEGQDSKPPVKLVVFDCDETLTLSTFMPKDRSFGTKIGWSEWPEYISAVNFESPFADGSRIDRLKGLLSDLKGDAGQERMLAVLTRNERGPVACLNLLMMAGLANYFSVVWALPAKDKVPNGVQRIGESEWRSFDPPVSSVADHKADVLGAVTQDLVQWIPQVGEGTYEHMKDLRLENIVLVDDVRTNFQSPFGKNSKLLRYCKVARYDGNHPQMGFVPDMGGIGAQSVSDYAVLKAFVNRPWEHRAHSSLQCFEREFDCCQDQPAAELVVFEFDETLSICTFVNEDARFSKDIGFLGASEIEMEHFRKYNFESPYLESSRVEKLDSLLKAISQNKVLAILTENSVGAVAVLNLLKIANLADYFSAIWAPCAEGDQTPTGVFQHEGQWQMCNCPAGKVKHKAHRAEMIHSIADQPADWFPQLNNSPAAALLTLKTLATENIVVVDDERTNFISSASAGAAMCASSSSFSDPGDGTDSFSADDRKTVHRYCRVARYDDDYRDQGWIIHMGGIGAKADSDYQRLVDFINEPWRYRVVEPSWSAENLMGSVLSLKSPNAADDEFKLERRMTEEYLDKTPMARRKLSMSSESLSEN